MNLTLFYSAHFFALNVKINGVKNKQKKKVSKMKKS